MSLACVFLPLARSTNHEPGRCCLRMFRSTCHRCHPWFLVPSRYCDFINYLRLYQFSIKLMFGERKFIIFSLFRTTMVFWNPVKKVFTNYYILQIFEVTLSLIFGYISSTTWFNTKLRFVRFKVLCILIFVYVHNYSILFFFTCACHEILLYGHSNFWGCEVNF